MLVVISICAEIKLIDPSRRIIILAGALRVTKGKRIKGQMM
jgi:hypothetical protein